MAMQISLLLCGLDLGAYYYCCSETAAALKSSPISPSLDLGTDPLLQINDVHNYKYVFYNFIKELTLRFEILMAVKMSSKMSVTGHIREDHN
jgi:hypothetical protein